MKLATYLDTKSLSRREFAELLGVTEVTICRYINGTRFPRSKEMTKIAEITSGDVTPNDFVLGLVVSEGAAA